MRVSNTALRNPGYASEDLGLGEALRFGERSQLRLYFQMFNAFNRQRLSGPSTQIGTAGFGEVLAQNLNGLPGPRVRQAGTRFTF